LAELDFLFIENVGNLLCPSSYDLDENLRLVLLSVTEGEDKLLKYPTIFNSADVAVITKTDLATAVEFDWESALANIRAVRGRSASRSYSCRVTPDPRDCEAFTEPRQILGAGDERTNFLVQRVGPVRQPVCPAV
jgi:Ni2+-binding GTPase involved in maturation of urease and hydrogenase